MDAGVNLGLILAEIAHNVAILREQTAPLRESAVRVDAQAFLFEAETSLHQMPVDGCIAIIEHIPSSAAAVRLRPPE